MRPFVVLGYTPVCLAAERLLTAGIIAGLVLRIALPCAVLRGKRTGQVLFKRQIALVVAELHLLISLSLFAQQ